MRRIAAVIILTCSLLVPVGFVAYETVVSGCWLPTLALVGVMLIAITIAWASDVLANEK